MVQPLNTKNHNVCAEIVSNDLCIGCGICAGICPPQVLRMEFSEKGEYIPIEYKAGCLTKCDLCLRACPFWDQIDNEDTIGANLFGNKPDMEHDSATGYYTAIYAGHVTNSEARIKSASGGLTTWFLQNALKQGSIDAAISVRPTQNPNCLFEFAIFETSEAIQNAAGSAYYPVEMSSVIREIINGPEKRYAIVGLPCFLKAIRLAMRTNRRLRQRVVHLVGLVCGQVKSKFFTEYLSAAGNGSPQRLEQAQFRVKDLHQPAYNFMLHFEHSTNDGKNYTVQYHRSDRALRTWEKRYFAPNACSYCDDVFAELADIAFMDAWIPPYLTESKGTNIILIRKPALIQEFEQGQENDEIELTPFDIEQVVQSQAGVIKFKRALLPQRLKLAKDAGRIVPRKRIEPAASVTFGERWTLRLYQAFMVNSKKHWGIHRTDVSTFHKKMQWLEFQYRLPKTFLRLKYLPKQLLRKIGKLLSRYTSSNL